jgi:hypothetical protein
MNPTLPSGTAIPPSRGNGTRDLVGVNRGTSPHPLGKRGELPSAPREQLAAFTAMVATDMQELALDARG